MPQLDPTWFASQLFWLAVSMVVLYVALSRLVLPPLQAVIELRRTTREGDLAMAQQLKTEAESAREEYERALADARLRAQAIFTDTELKNKQATEAALAEINRTLTARMAEAEKRITESKRRLLGDLQPAGAELAAQIVEKLVGRTPDPTRAQAAIKKLTPG